MILIPIFIHKSSLNENIQVLQRGSDIYVVVEPSEDSKSPVFAVNVLDSTTGETTKTVQIPCQASYDHIAYVGNYIFWTESDLLKWSSIDKKDVKSILLKVERSNA